MSFSVSIIFNLCTIEGTSERPTEEKSKSDNVINKINNKLLNDNMKILPYQNIKVRNKFIDKLLGDVELYKINSNLFFIKFTKHS